MSETSPSTECAWCGQALSKEGEFHAVGATATDPSELEVEDGHMIGIEFPEQDRTVFALVPPPGSPAKQKQHDLWFNLCSEECAQTLQTHLQSNTDLISDTEIPD